MKIRDFLRHHYRHFNAATVVEAAEAYRRLLDSGWKMMVTIAGAMSTAEIGLSLAEMIRQGKVHAICCTGANLEEDLFNLVAHDHYHRVPDWRNLTPEEEKDLESRGLNRVTDTCIPEEEAFKTIEDPILELWQKAGRAGERLFPHEYLFQLLNEGTLADRYQVDPTDSWMVAAAERNLPLFVPGWEDSSLANVFVARVLDGKVSSFEVVKSGLEYMAELVDWYARQTMGRGIDELEQHPEGPPGVRRKACPYWSYFCQISDSTTSYGSYSGAFPTEKITWGKLDVDTPKFLIESDATIVAPLIFAHVLGW
jgi:deoxyhypusine synthase